MPLQKDKKDKDIQINLKDKSSLAEFTKRPVPSEKEVEEFEEYIEESDQNELPPVADIADQEQEKIIDEGLNEIYQDEKGKMVDVSKLTIKKKRGFVFWFLFIIIFSSLAGLLFYFSYNYVYFKNRSDATAFDFSLKTKDSIVAGEEFFYTLTYQNKNIVPVDNVEIKIKFPDNFIFLDSSLPSKSGTDNVWLIPSLAPNQKGEIKIKGKIIDKEDATEIALASITYVPENFSSEFKKDTSVTTKVRSVGLDFNFDYFDSVLLGEDGELKINFKPEQENYFNNFRLSVEPQENLNIVSLNKGDDSNLEIKEIRNGVWDILNFDSDKNTLVLYFNFSEKKNDKEKIVLHFTENNDNDIFYEFYSYDFEVEVVKSSLSLTMIINGSREDGGVDLGDTLNYTIAYANKGETEMKNLLIMAVLDGEFLDWGTLKDDLGGKKRGNTITWTKEELPALEYLSPGDEGTIDFSIKLLGSENIEESNDFEIKSYAQYGLGEDNEIDFEDVDKKTGDNKSNTIVKKINSNLSFKEELRYFNDDNIPVGTGPHPPKVGKETTYKVYWRVKNTLHDLEDLKVSTVLPKGVSFAGKELVSLGTLHYNEESGELIWQIGRLPASAKQADAEFSIGITPSKEDKNKIMVLLNGSLVEATDAQTKSKISRTSKSQTTILKDDKTAYEQTGGDGVVE